MTHPPGLIGVLSGELSRYTWFAQSLLALDVPAGSNVAWVTSGPGIADAVNLLLTKLQPEHAWVQIWADDHIFEPDTLMRLLDHQVDLVAPLCASRHLPYPPSVFHETPAGFVGYNWDELAGQHGLVPVDSFGGPGVVIRRRVLEAVGMPFFEHMPEQRTTPMEDLYSFSKCRKAGFQPMVDLDLAIGHITTVALYPQRLMDASFGVRLWSSQDLAILRPIHSQDHSAAHAHGST